MIATYLKAHKNLLVAVGVAVGLAGGGFMAGCAYAQQPHMQAAMNYLQSAKGELEVAEHNKGGHRVTAIRLVNDAIGQVAAGIAAGS